MSTADQPTAEIYEALMDWRRRHTQVMSDYPISNFKDEQERFETMAAEIAVLRRSVSQ